MHVDKTSLCITFCCILETHSHRRCNNNITDVTQEVMLHNNATYFALAKLSNSAMTTSHVRRTFLPIIEHKSEGENGLIFIAWVHDSAHILNC